MTNAAITYTAPLRISQDHPALPGHFPGQPLIPGVVLLDRVLDAAQSWLGRPVSVRSLQQAKFVAPLLPDQEASIEMTLQEDTLRFVVRRDATTIAQGAMLIAAEMPA